MAVVLPSSYRVFVAMTFWITAPMTAFCGDESGLGKLEGEFELNSPATKFFNMFATQIHDLPNISDVVHDGKLHQGDWHSVGSDNIKQWNLFIDGRVQTLKEHYEEIDHANKTLIFNVFDGDVSKQYKTLKATLKVTEKGNNASVARWTFDYEKLHEGIPPPQPFLDYVTKLTKDVDAHLNKTTT